MSEINVGRMVLGPVQTNCYYVYRKDAGEAVVIDPADSGARIYDTLKKNGLKAAAVLLTHGHFDHILGVKELAGLTGAKLYAAMEEKELLADAGINCSVDIGRDVSLSADVWLEDGESLTLAGMEFSCITTPGHTRGGICYYLKEAGILFSGDTLFQESVGRTDWPTGSMGALMRSVKEKLLTLPEDVTVYPGHGDETTVAYEKKYNPYCR